MKPAGTSALLVVLATSAFGQGAPAPPVPPTIGGAEIEAAKALLAQARQALQPQQYQVLEKGLVEAETAFQRFSSLAKASGKAAEVARGAEALTGAQRASQFAARLGAVSRAGPALVALALLWPSSTATQEQDYPSWMKARHELEMKLRQVAMDSQRVSEELEAAADKKRPKDKDWCGSCFCFGAEGPLGQKESHRDCRKECERLGRVPVQVR